VCKLKIWSITTLSAAGLLFLGFSATAAKKMSKEYLNVGGKKPPGYTHVVKSPPGTMVFISGQGGTAADGTMPADFSTQTRNTFENLKKCLALAGASFKHVVKINYFVTDIKNITELRRVRAEYLDMERPPASTLVQAGLTEGLQIEVEAVAVIPD
jgi:enamine deaminase RidA (YjgF/YER057c/UK114 family)